MGSQLEASVKPPMLKDHRLSSTVSPLELLGEPERRVRCHLVAAAGSQADAMPAASRSARGLFMFYCFLLIFDKTVV